MCAGPGRCLTLIAAVDNFTFNQVDVNNNRFVRMNQAAKMKTKRRVI